MLFLVPCNGYVSVFFSWKIIHCKCVRVCECVWAHNFTSTTNGILMKFSNYSNTHHFICMITYTHLHSLTHTQTNKQTQQNTHLHVFVMYLLSFSIFAHQHCELTRKMLIVVVVNCNFHRFLFLFLYFLLLNLSSLQWLNFNGGFSWFFFAQK